MGQLVPLRFGSFILTMVEMCRAAMERLRRQERGNILVCLLAACMECVYALIEYISKFATLQAAMTVGLALFTLFCSKTHSIDDSQYKSEKQSLLDAILDTSLTCQEYSLYNQSDTRECQPFAPGDSFCDAASTVTDLLQRNFLTAYGTYAFPSMILQGAALVLAVGFGVATWWGGCARGIQLTLSA
jgi:hypothetical protein